MNKTVKYLVPAYDINMGGVMLKQALPTDNVPNVNPFLLLHHADLKFSEYAKAIKQGVGPHPHRGFSPVTFVIDGEVHHRDSRGNNQIAKKGEVQWMHAGAGIIHSERPSKDLVAKNGRQEIIQLWINSPADRKMVQPRYQYLVEEDTPVFLSDDQQIKSKLIAGDYKDKKGKIVTERELIVIWGTADENGKKTYAIDEKFSTMLYVVKGEVKIDGYGMVEKESLVVFDNTGVDIGVSCKPDTQFLLLAGVAINEKVVQQGPFVMNTETQILEAHRDYQMGKMGILIEED